MLDPLQGFGGGGHGRFDHPWIRQCRKKVAKKVFCAAVTRATLLFKGDSEVMYFFGEGTGSIAFFVPSNDCSSGSPLGRFTEGIPKWAPFIIFTSGRHLRTSGATTGWLHSAYS